MGAQADDPLRDARELPTGRWRAQPGSAGWSPARATASIGQVHRATTVDGAEVAVKIQYARVAEAVETDLRNATLLPPLVKRLAPGLDAKALLAELRDRIGEELDYELEAQNQRRRGN